MRRALSVLGTAAALQPACLLDLSVVPGAAIGCEMDADCPAPTFCNPATHTCARVDELTTSAAIRVAPTSGLSTGEDGGAASFAIEVTTAPSAPVTVAVLSDTPDECVPAAPSVTFSSGRAASLNVEVVGVDDPLADGDRPCLIRLDAAQSDDLSYAGLDPADVSGTNLDDDVAALLVMGAENLFTREAGGTATFSVRLSTQPSDLVSLAVRSDTPAEGEVTANLVFTPENWADLQFLTVTGVDDARDDDDQDFAVVLEPLLSADPDYAGLDPPDVLISNLDDDTAGLQVVPTSGLVTTETGLAAAFVLIMASEPSANVVVPLLCDTPNEAALSAASVTFTPLNWRTPQAVVVRGLDDEPPATDGDQEFAVAVGPSLSTDLDYDALALPDVEGTNLDMDSPGLVVVPSGGLLTSESGASATFTVVLRIAPTASVQVDLAASVPDEISFAPPSLTFTDTDWDEPQEVVVTGLNDAPPVRDGNRNVTISLDASSTDSAYDVIVAETLLVNIDNDIAAIVGVPPSLSLSEGKSSTFYLRLATQPLANVGLTVSLPQDAEATIDTGAALTFTPANWNDDHPVTITATDDELLDGNSSFLVDIASTGGADPYYSALATVVVGGQTRDDELRLQVVYAGNGSFGASGGLADSATLSDGVCAGGVPSEHPLKALLAYDTSTPTSDRGANPILNWPLLANRVYFRNGITPTRVGKTNAEALFDFPLDAPLKTGGTDLIWTGLVPDWLTGQSCFGWTDGSSGSGGYVGNPRSVNADAFMSDDYHLCEEELSIVCVEAPLPED